MLRPAFFQSFYESTTNGWQNAWHQWISPQESQQDINGKMRFSARKHHIATQKVISWFVNPINYTIVIGVMFTNLANELGHHLADSSLLICHLTLVVLLKTLGLLVVNPRSLLRIDVAGGAILVDWLVEVHMKYRLRPETLFLGWLPVWNPFFPVAMALSFNNVPEAQFSVTWYWIEWFLNNFRGNVYKRWQ